MSINFTKRIIFAVVAIMASVNSFGQNVLWGTYCGGQTSEVCTGVATDVFGNVYITGNTNSSSGIASGGFKDTITDGKHTEAFLVKYDASGNRLWGTYYGGSPGGSSVAYYTNSYAVATDLNGNVFMAGTTSCQSGIASGGFQNTYGGDFQDDFLVKFDANGNRLWATYYGGPGMENGYNGLATDAQGNVYLTGTTFSDAGIGYNGFQSTYQGRYFNGEPSGYEAYLVKFNAAGNRIWATYYGRSGTNCQSVAVDLNGNVYLGGITADTAGIAFGGFQNSYGSAANFSDAYLVKFDSAGKRLWGTYYGDGGNGWSRDSRVTTDISGNIYLAGDTYCSSGIASNGFRNNFTGADKILDAYVAKFNTAGSRIWATYYGGNKEDRLAGVLTDASGNLYITGHSYSDTGIAAGGFQNAIGGARSEFIAGFDSSGKRICGTYFGENETWMEDYNKTDGFAALSIDGNIYIAGYADTAATGIAFNGFQNKYAGGKFDVTLAKVSPCSSIVLPKPKAAFVVNDSVICNSNCVNFTSASINATSWRWNFSGATPSSSTSQNPKNICYSQPGVYDVSLIVSNNSGMDTLKRVSYIHLVQAVAGIVTSNHDTLCAGSNLRLTLTGSSGTIQWQSASTQGGFTFIAGATNAIYNTALNHTTAFRVITKNGGCGDTSVSRNIYITPTLVASFTDSLTGYTAKFNSDESSGAISGYNWDFGDGGSSSDKNPVHTFATTDSFNVCLTIYDGSNCSYTSCKQLITGVNGITSPVGSNKWNIYPDASGNYFFINHAGVINSTGSVEIFDMLGRMVLLYAEDKAISGTLKINVAALTTGIYCLRVKAGGTTCIQKIVKQ